MAKFIKEADVVRWVAALAADSRVLVPTDNGATVEFEEYDAEKGMTLERQPTAPPKKAVFPQTETLVKYRFTKDPEDPSKVQLQVKDTVEKMKEEKTVVFGCRPCGARGFTMFDRVYTSDKVTDPYYKARRDATTFVSLACAEVENTCFCNWVGSGPADTEGSDVVLVPVDGGYVAEAVTPRGEEALAKGTFEDAGDKAEAAEKVKQEAMAALGDAPDLSDVPEKLLEKFDNGEFWEEMSSKCISCGTCTYLCPTCYCFNITDDANGLSGKRIRTWDNCMSNLFTMEASGHNPRNVKANRLKNRVGHKFSYYPNLHNGVISCCGCGRCIKSCPALVDIREIVLSAKER